MDYEQLQNNLENLGTHFTKDTFIFDFLSAYELPKSTITLLKKDPYKLSQNENQIILRSKIFFDIAKPEPEEYVHAIIDDLQKDKSTQKHKPRFIIVTDFVTFLAVDTKTGETLDIDIKNIWKHYTFFLPLVGMEKTQHQNETVANVRAAGKLAKLYDQIVIDNSEYAKKYSHDLNVFLSRLLFCYFAEDTKIFTDSEDGIFINSIDSHTNKDGKDLKEYIRILFSVLNTEEKERENLASHFIGFPYVNGGLFNVDTELPNFTQKSRDLIIECGKLDWSEINPDIFGSMIQAVVIPDQRENLGMHYTSEPNILKVIEPLFLDKLHAEFSNAGNNVKKLEALRKRIINIKIFDPACGSGNFLIISYNRLCQLESLIIDKILSLGKSTVPSSGIKLNSFYGIEIDDFAHGIAKLSLWIAQYQVNELFTGLFPNADKSLLPLRESGNIKLGNATRIDWNDVCPRVDENGQQNEIYVIGNPPYLGFLQQKKPQKKDMDFVFSKNVVGYKKLDYISCWFYKVANYINNSQNIESGFVSTNSVTQGEQVSILWPKIFNSGIEIHFAHQSFLWTNLAKGNAGVSCVVIGLRANKMNEPKFLYSKDRKEQVANINGYLANTSNIFIRKRTSSLSNLPAISLGSSAYDGGNLMLTEDERNLLIDEYPDSARFIKRFMGAAEFIRDIKRYCIWIEDKDVNDSIKIPEIKKRLEYVKTFRNASKRGKTLETASTPHKFTEIRQQNKVGIIAPIISSESRKYIPFGFIDKNIIVPNSARIIHDPEPYMFGIINSNMHMVWVRAVAGRLKTDLRYSGTICYNTFPFPDTTHKQRELITEHVYNILDERQRHPDKTMAELYNPDRMPDGLKQAHEFLDKVIDKIYRTKPFKNDEERLAHLFKLYEKMITNENNK